MSPLPPLPRWILIVSILFTLLELFAAIALCFYPQSMLESVDLGAKGVSYLVYMWAARQFALAVILGFASFKRSAPMLTLAWLFLLVMFTGDLVIGFVEKNNAMIITAAVMCLVAAGIIWAVNRRVTAGS